MRNNSSKWRRFLIKSLNIKNNFNNFNKTNKKFKKNKRIQVKNYYKKLILVRHPTNN